MHLLYSCGFMSASQRTWHMRGIRNSLPAGPCEYICVTHIGSVKNGAAVLCSISRNQEVL